MDSGKTARTAYVFACSQTLVLFCFRLFMLISRLYQAIASATIANCLFATHWHVVESASPSHEAVFVYACLFAAFDLFLAMTKT